MTLQILILTQRARRVFLRQLLSVLEPQLAAHSLANVCISMFDSGKSLGENRERMRQQATASYIVFLDDDDLVSPNYISGIMPLLDGVDQVTFDVQIIRNGKQLKPAKHSLAYGGWHEDGSAYYRDISHATPMRRELALEVPMSGGFGEDFRWAKDMRGRVKTEHHIDDFLYYYLLRHPKNDARDVNDPARLALIEKLKPTEVESLA